MNESQPTKQGDSLEIEINLRDIIRFIQVQFWRIAAFALVFGILGGIYAFTAQKEYQAQAIILPELQSSSSFGKSGGLGALAGLAGIDLGMSGSTDAIRPDLYPSIIQSLPFLMHLSTQSVYVSESKKNEVLGEFLRQKQQTWLGKLMGTKPKSMVLLDPNKASKTLEISLEKELLIKDIGKRVVAGFDRKTGIISISVEMPDPVVAAHVTQITIEYLKEYVTNYRTDKAKRQMKFIGGQVVDAKRRYQSAEVALASYQDQNRFLIIQTAKVQQARLQADFLMAQSVYNDLSRQHEQAKIRVEEETPVFKTLEPPRVPLLKSKPKRMTIIFTYLVLGTFVGLLYTLYKAGYAKKYLG